LEIKNTNAKEIWKENFIDVYNQPEFVIERGNGSKVYDVEGNEYIDFTSGYGVSSLGYGDEDIKKALKNQIDEILHTSNLFFNKPMLKTGAKLVEVSEMSKVYFCNSGTEANETAFKIARKYSSEKYGNNRGVIISLSESFHGRTMMSLMATGIEKYHAYFYPLPEGFRHVAINDIEGFKSAVDISVCAVILESVQGEGGVNPLDKSYVDEVVDICRKNDIAIIFDEVQAGIGRTGKLFGYQNLGVKPDIVTTAKGLSAGIPVGAVLVSDKYSKVLSIGDQGTTFGANPLAMVSAEVVIGKIESPGFYDEVNKKGAYIKKFIGKLNSDKIVDIRGVGLFIGIEVSGRADEIQKKARDKGLLILTAGHNDVVRFLPPLTITYDEIDEALEILKGCF
jgi:acetylornithine/N-succinyldiaminopimelate aminotransferase